MFMFFSLEHSPIHVHVVGDGEAKFDWTGTKFELTYNHGIKVNVLKKIKQMVDDNADIIVSRWSEYFKEVKL